MIARPLELIWSVILLTLVVAYLTGVTQTGSSSIASSLFVSVAAILGTMGKDVAWRTRAMVVGSVVFAFNARRFGIPQLAATIVLGVAGSILMMEAFRPPAGSQKKQFSWTLWIIALGVLALVIWFVPEYLMPMFGIPVTN